ncbi:MAG: hypothetical protein IKI84_05760 [Clostridia bacterium]|nr:hypothetical protein [Clostridia bacterium]
MKAAKRFATALRIIGWLMVAVSLGVTIYAAATSSGPWGNMAGALGKYGGKTTVLDRVDFDRRFYSALNDAADTRTMQANLRTERVRTIFSSWGERLGSLRSRTSRARWMPFMPGQTILLPRKRKLI